MRYIKKHHFSIKRKLKGNHRRIEWTHMKWSKEKGKFCSVGFALWFSCFKVNSFIQNMLTKYLQATATSTQFKHPNIPDIVYIVEHKYTLHVSPYENWWGFSMWRCEGFHAFEMYNVHWYEDYVYATHMIYNDDLNSVYILYAISVTTHVLSYHFTDIDAAFIPAWSTLYVKCGPTTVDGIRALDTRASTQFIRVQIRF